MTKLKWHKRIRDKNKNKNKKMNKKYIFDTCIV